MISSFVFSLVSVVIVSMISLVGIIALSLKEERLKKYIGIFIALAIGALLGDAFIHIIPEAFESMNHQVASLLLIAGLILFFIIEKVLHWHHHGEDKDNTEAHPVGKMILISDGFHNFLDGVVIGASFMVSVPLGMATTLAVILHEIPQEIGDFGVLIHSGYSKLRALFLNFTSALMAVIGVVFVFIFGETAENFSIFVLPIAAGGFIYIAVADLIPELHKKNASSPLPLLLQIVVILLGILAMFALTLVE